MGTLFSTIILGRAGLQTAQIQLDVAGHNIASVNKEGFSRQRAHVSTQDPNITFYGILGRGPYVENVLRVRDPFLDTVYRTQVETLGYTDVASRFYAQLEDLYLEPGDEGFSDRLSVFFDALGDYSNSVEELPVRVATLAEAEALAASLNDTAIRLNDLRTNANDEIEGYVAEINNIADQIADLNVKIRGAELSGREANDLRDDRDVLLDNLSRIISVSWSESESGQISVLAGGGELVGPSGAFTLEAVRDATIDPDRPDFYAVRYLATGTDLSVSGGELEGAIFMRDTAIPELQRRMDDIALALIESMNQIQSQGRGLEPIGTSLTSANQVSGLGTALNSAGLPLAVQDGSFDIVIYDDSTGLIAETVTVNITATGVGQTTLSDIEAAINGATNMGATANADGTITLNPAAGYSFVFANDTANALPALGLNSFFVGDGADNIAVSQHLLDDPALLSSGYSLNLLDTGDNTAALAMAQLRGATVLESGTQTFDDFYQATIVQVGIDARSNSEQLEVSQAFLEDVEQRRQEVSGVNLDEEVSGLIMFQRAYEASARVITVTDRMLDALMGLVQ